MKTVIIHSGRHSTLSFLAGLIVMLSALSGKADLPTTPPGTDLERAIWIWDMGPKLLLGNQRDRDLFYSFITAPHGVPEARITTLFMFLETTIHDAAARANKADCGLRYRESARAFIADLHSRGLAVHYLDGDPLWALSGPHNEGALRLIAAICNYNASAAKAERFDGLQFDVEPYLLNQRHPLSWAKNQAEIWLSFVANVRQWQFLIRDHNQKHQDKLKLGLAIPHWWDSQAEENSGNFRTLLNLVDYLALMAYETRANEANSHLMVLDIIRDEIEYASDPNGDGLVEDARTGSIYAGLETIQVNWKETNPESFFRQLYMQSTSFHTHSNQALENAVQEIVQNYGMIKDNTRKYPGLAGIAVHYYEDIDNGDCSYRAMPHTLSKRAPACTVISPNGHEIISRHERVPVRFRLINLEVDALKVDIAISADGGTHWDSLIRFDTLTPDLIGKDGAYDLDLSAYQPGNYYRVKITAKNTGADGLIGFDMSDYDWKLVDAIDDHIPPYPTHTAAAIVTATIPGRDSLIVEWPAFTDHQGILGYFYSLFPPHAWRPATFTRGLQGYIEQIPLGNVPLYVWAVDYSGNLSPCISGSITQALDFDHDGIADSIDPDIDGDGISDDMELKLNSNPLTPDSIPGNLIVGHWDFNHAKLDNRLGGQCQLLETRGKIDYLETTEEEEPVINVPWAENDLPALGMSDPGAPSSASAFTIEMWIKPRADERIRYMPLVFIGDLDNGLSLLLKDDTHSLTARLYYPAAESPGTFLQVYHPRQKLFDGQWHHVAISYNGYHPIFKLYVDGELVSRHRSGKIPPTLPWKDTLRFFTGNSKFDHDNGVECELATGKGCVMVADSAQFENNYFSHVNARVGYVGMVDNIRVTLADIPPILLGYYRDTSRFVDRDRDGMNDHWEKYYFKDVNPAPDDDPDDDGQNNLLEFKHSTHPRIP